MNINEIRFIEDDPHNFVINDTPNKLNEERFNTIRRSLYSNYVLVTEDLFPDISKSIDNTKEKIPLNTNFEVFIQPSATPQSLSITLGSENNLAVVLTSSLIDLLNNIELQFVLGHEIGHHIFGHYKYPQPEDSESEHDYLQSLYLSRCAEISADRLGFLACPSLDDAILGIIKIASGLSKKHIRVDFSSYINQLKHNKNIKSYKDQVFNTHPIFPLRARALIWFSMSERFYKLSQKNESAPIRHDQLENMVQKDLHDVSDKLFLDKENDLINNALLWGSLKLAIADNVIAKKDQKYIKEHLPPILVDKAIKFLKGSPSKANKIIEERLRDSLKAIEKIRKSKKEFLQSEINSIAQKLDADPKHIKDILKNS